MHASSGFPGGSIRWRRSLGAICLGLGAVLAASGALAAEPVTRMLPDFTDLVEQVGPAVVNIRTEEKVHVDPRSAQIDPGMEELFRRFGIPPRAAPRGDDNGESDDEEPTRRGVGSGFILSADGLIMTNAHVVSGADELTVTLPDKREFKAKLVGADKRSDVALVKIDAANLPTVKIGDVGKLKVGEWVIAIGSPFNFENTVTAGIVSAKQRDTGELLPFIQTDVAINPGNSGAADQHARRGGRHQFADLQPVRRLCRHLLLHPHRRGHAGGGPAAHQRPVVRAASG
jgi:serine protease Do